MNVIARGGVNDGERRGGAGAGPPASPDDLARVFAEHGAPTRELLRRRFGRAISEDDLDDALSSALVRLWEKRSAFDPARASLGAFYYLLARNAAVDLIRRRRDSSGRIDEATPAPVPPSFGEIDPALRARLGEAVATLSGADRDILESYLSGDGGWGWSLEVARRLGLSPSHVRVRRLRIIESLKSRLSA